MLKLLLLLPWLVLLAVGAEHGTSAVFWIAFASLAVLQTFAQVALAVSGAVITSAATSTVRRTVRR